MKRPWSEGLKARGVAAALIAAALFGAGTPVAKRLLTSVDPWLLAGLLYAGAGVALTLLRRLRKPRRVELTAREWRYLAGIIVTGGVLGPVLLMYGLAHMPASGVSLLLNAEGVFTALLAWCAFRENVDRRVALGMLAIATGAVTLSWSARAEFGSVWPSVLVLAACLAWAIDNNLTRKLSLHDAIWLAAVKCSTAGAINLLIATAISNAAWPSPAGIVTTLGVGALAYGTSLVLFVIGLRHLGAARTGAYFSTAPFVGALLAIVWLGDPVTLPFVAAALLMSVGVWLHLTERHDHVHRHEAINHSHEHSHDDIHHAHGHSPDIPPATRHTHRHRHEPAVHSHHHFPDAHHQHEHE